MKESNIHDAGNTLLLRECIKEEMLNMEKFINRKQLPGIFGTTLTLSKCGF